MSKRTCPFEYNMMPQLKIRLSEKDYNIKKNKTNIHDRTLQLLFNGASKLHKTNPFPKIENACAAVNVSEFCVNCSDLNVVESKCSFCEKWICQACLSACIKCREIYCLAHLIKLYLSDENDCICFSCNVEGGL